MLRRIPTFIAILCVLALLPYACTALLRPSGPFFATDDRKTVEAVNARIPIGTPISEARRIMEDYGFHCIQMRNKKPTGDDAADTLYCDSGERYHAWMISKRWQVMFLEADGKVSQVTAGVGLTGL